MGFKGLGVWVLGLRVLGLGDYRGLQAKGLEVEGFVQGFLSF